MSGVDEHWSDNEEPDDVSDALKNVEWALGQLLDAIEAGRYRYERVHVEADLRYLRGEVRRAKRQHPSRVPSTSEGE